jgi:hypothetical protein
MGLIILAVLAVLLIVDVIVFSLEKYEWSVGIMVVSIAGAYFFQPEFHTFVATGWFAILTKYVPIYLLAGLATAFVKWGLFILKRANAVRDVKQDFDVKYPVDEQIITGVEAQNRAREEARYNEALDRFNRYQKRAKGVPQYADGTVDVSPPTEAPIPPVFEPIPADQAAANRREAFVNFYSKKVEYRANHKVYTADHSQTTSVVDALTPRARDNVGLITLWIFQWPVVIVETLIADFLIKLGKHAARLFDQLFSYFSRKLFASATKGL